MSIVRRQGNKRGIAGNSSSLSITLDSTPGNGNMLIAAIGTYGSYPPYVSSISQSNVTWTQQVTSSSWSLYGRRVEIWAGVVSYGVSPSSTLTIYLGDSGSGANSDPIIADVCEYSGIVTSNFRDQTGTALGSYTRPLSTGTTPTTTQPNELWIGGIFNVCDAANGNNDSSPTNGFTMLDGAGSVYSQTKSLAYLEKIVSSTGTASCSVTGGAYSTYEAYAGCIATFRGVVNNDNHLSDSTKWEVDNGYGSGTHNSNIDSIGQGFAYTYYDASSTYDWGNTEYEQAYDLFRYTDSGSPPVRTYLPWGSTWTVGVVPLTKSNQKISYSALLSSVGGPLDGQGNAYIDLWIMFDSATGDPGNGDSAYKFAEIEIFIHKSGDPFIWIGKTTTDLRHDPNAGDWYFVGYHASALSDSSFTSQTVDLNSIINVLQSHFGCDLSIGAVVGITFGVECSHSYMGATFDYVTYQY